MRLASVNGRSAVVWSSGPAALSIVAGLAPSRLVVVTDGVVADFLARLLPVLDLPDAPDHIAELSDFAGLVRAPRVVAASALGDVLDLLRRGPELIVVDGTDLALRDAIRGITDLNGFPPVPAAAEDSRFRVEDGRVFCSDEPLFPFPAGADPASPASGSGGSGSGGSGSGGSGSGGSDGADGHALCVALAVLDGIGADVPARSAELQAALNQ